jgi:hypothetical protein
MKPVFEELRRNTGRPLESQVWDSMRSLCAGLSYREYRFFCNSILGDEWSLLRNNIIGSRIYKEVSLPWNI